MRLYHIIQILILIFFVSSFVMADTIALPGDLNVQANIVKSERDGRWEKTLIVQFPDKRRILSSNDGIIDAMAVGNHAAHPELWACVCESMKNKHEVGGKVYMKIIREKVAGQLGLQSKDISLMATAVDMDNMAVATKKYNPFTVTALVTAGAKSNAIRTGTDEGIHIEKESIEEKPPTMKESSIPGTINILILTNVLITDGGMARAVITATEAKTAALEDLRVPSSYTKNARATGTGTDSIIIVSGTSGPQVTYPGGHSKIGELMGKAVYKAVVEALGKQNGFKINR